MVVSGIDCIRKIIQNGRFGEAQTRIEQALPTYPTSEELHDLLLDLVTRQPALKGWAELLLAQIQDDTGKREATLARLRGAPLPASDAPAPADNSGDVVAAPDKELPVSPEHSPGRPVPLPGPAPKADGVPPGVDQPRAQTPPDAPSREPKPAVGPLPETKPVPGTEGLTYYQRGRAAMNQQPPDLKEAILWFERVPDSDPDSALSNSQLDILKNHFNLT